MKTARTLIIKFICLLPALILLFYPLAAKSAAPPKVTFQLADVSWEGQFQPIMEDIPLIPLRALANECGAVMSWHEESKLIFYFYGGRAAAFHPKLNQVYIFEENPGMEENNSPWALFTCIEGENLIVVREGVSYISGDNLPFLAMEAFWDADNLDIGLSPEVYSESWPLLGTPQTLYELAREDIEYRISQIPKLLSSFTTNFNPNDKNRTVNLKLAAAAINEIRIAPGVEFSFNNAVGVRSPQRGYLKAIIFSSGDKVLGYGGGICQVSSTLYNAVLEAGLRITERHPHGQKVDYAPAGRDATVVYGVKDFRFINSLDKLLIIKTTVGSNSLEIQLWQ